MNQSVEKIVLTPQECMGILGVGRNTMYEKILKDKSFPCFKVGNKIFINKAKLQEWIDSQCR